MSYRTYKTYVILKMAINLEEQKIREHPLLREWVADAVRDMIAKGKLKPGEHICETRLASELGISRTPLREAIRLLETEGFLHVVPRRGAVVRDISIKDVTEIYEIKAALEGLSARLAARHFNKKDIERLKEINNELAKLAEKNDVNRFFKMHNQFHDYFLRASGNERLYQMNCSLIEQIHRLRLLSFTLEGRFEEAVAQHEKIIKAFEKMDAELAERLVSENVMMGYRAVTTKLKQTKTA